MKRFLALLLVLCTLLCLYPMVASAEEAPVAQSEETGSYLDLYVKEGLVALYDAYSGVAGDEFTGTAAWYAVDFYGKEGYDDYAPLSTSKADLMAGVNMRWKWENGYLQKASGTNTPSTGGTGHRDDNYSFIRLNTLGAQLLADVNSQFTVQQVYQLLGGITKDIYLSTPKVENGVVVNADTITAYPYTYGGGFTVGDLGSSYDYHTWVSDGKYVQGGVWRASFTGCYSNSAYFLGEYYNVLQGADPSNASRWVRMGETGVVFETITRTSSTRYDVDFRNGITYTNGSVWTNYPCTISSPAGSTVISLQRGIRARVFSIRIYNTKLTAAQNDQNYLADLFGAYKVDASKVAALSAEELAILVSRAKSIDLPKDDADFATGKAALEGVLSEFMAELEEIKEQATILAQKDARLELYVKDGLVALFDFNNSVASASQIKSFAPVNFYGKAGYGDYVDPSLYTADIAGGAWDVLEWYYEDNYLAAKYNGNFGDRSNANYHEWVDLSDLAAIIGTTYTVQELFTFLQPGGAPTVSGGSVSVSTDFRFDSKNVFGALSISTTFSSYVNAGAQTGTWGDWNGGYAIPFTALNTGAGGAYRGHHIIVGEDLGAPLYDGIGHVGTDDITVERAIMRRGYYALGSSFVSEFYIHYTKAPTHRPGNTSWVGTDVVFDYASADESEHSSNTLYTMANTGAKYYSVKIYNKNLTEAELAQNHFADLVNFYKVNIADLSVLTTEQLAILADSTADIHVSADATKAAAAKTALKNAIEGYAGAIKEAAQNEIRLGLYVKEGLVAMFDGFNAEANATKLTVLTPMNLYGKAGYADYVDPSLYTADIVGGAWDVLEWYYEDGSISAKYNGNYGDRSQNSNYYEAVDLSDLAAIIGNTYTVQETFSYNVPAGAPTVTDGVLTSADAAFDSTRFGGKNLFGALTINAYVKPNIAGTGMGLTGSWDGWNGGFAVPFADIYTGNAYRGHHIYTEGTDYYDTLNYAGTDYNGVYVGTDGMIMERSVVRYGYTNNGDGTFTSKFAVRYAADPIYSPNGGNNVKSQNPFTYSSENEAEHSSNTLNVMANVGANYYSVRIYKTALNDAQIAQNHMADLVNYYRTDVSGIELLTPADMANLAAAVAELSIVVDKTSDAYASTKAALQDAFDAAVASNTKAETEAKLAGILAQSGIGYRTSGDYGVRALFTVDKAAVAALEAEGYTVVYGAVLGVLSTGSTVINESVESLTVGMYGTEASIATGKGQLVASNASMSYLTDDAVSFAMTITFKVDGSNASLYDATLIFRGYTAIVDAAGNAMIVYDDVDLSSAPELNTPSLSAVHTYALGNPDLAPELRDYLGGIFG